MSDSSKDAARPASLASLLRSSLSLHYASSKSQLAIWDRLVNIIIHAKIHGSILYRTNGYLLNETAGTTLRHPNAMH